MALYIGDTLIAGNIDGQQLNNPFSLLDYKYSEYELSNASWLLSNGQWNSGAVYQSVYNLLLQIYNGTVTKAGVSVKLSTEAYADTDFVLNTNDTTFRLPTVVKLASGKAVAGNGMTLGMTDGNINSGTFENGSNAYSSTNVADYGKAVGSTSTSGAGAFTNNTLIGITTDPTKSGIETSANGLYLYFYVGDTVQDANIIAAAGVLTDVVNLKAHSIVETYVNGTSWYRVYSDGWCEQGGLSDNGSAVANYTKTITFLKPFKDTNYTAFCTMRDGQSQTNVNLASVAGSSMNIVASPNYGNSYTQRYVYWQACGYIS